MFRNFILENFPFLEDDFDAPTDYALFCKMVAYMKQSLKNVEGFQKQINDFSAELVEFENYFNNLDVTEEVNAKLDEMVEDGTMEELIAEYLQLTTMYVYNSVAELKAAENLQEGMFAKTYGFYSYDDGGGANYKIRNVTTDDVIDDMFIIALHDNSLIAEYIVENNEINIKQMGCHGTYQDHSFNNSTIMQAIIDYAELKGVIVTIPKGFYGFSDTLYINNNITIKGIGTNRLWSGHANGPILYFSETDKPLFHISKLATLYSWNTTVSNLVENVHLSGFMIDGSGTGITGIYANCYLSSFKNIIISGFLNDISFVSCYELDVENCQFMLSRQNVIVYDCNTTTAFRNVYINGGNHTASSVITDETYLAKYTIPHMFNYCGLYTKIGKIYFENLAIENTCYAIISRDTNLYVDKCNIETISNYCFDVSIDLNPNARVNIDHCNFYNPSELNSAYLENVHYRARFNLKTINALPLTNIGYGTVASRAIDRIYSYISGERIISLTLSDNVTGATIVNKSHFTESGFKVHYEIIDASTWVDSKITSITTLPTSDSFGSENYNIFISPSKQKDVVYNFRLYGNGNLLFSSGAWPYKSSSSYLDNVIIDTEYVID